MKRSLLILVCVVCSCCAMAQSKDEAVITKMLKAQEDAWNRGSLDDFMKGYWNNDSLLFIGSKGPKYGYKITLENYKKGYPDIAHMGHFTSTLISMKRLAPDCYSIVGSWALARTAGDVSGYYTLLIKKINGEWVIVMDHSS